MVTTFYTLSFRRDWVKLNLKQIDSLKNSQCIHLYCEFEKGLRNNDLKNLYYYSPLENFQLKLNNS